MTDPNAPAPSTAPRRISPIPMPNLHSIASALETIAFIVATILAILNNGADITHATQSALAGAVFHAYNH